MHSLRYRDVESSYLLLQNCSLRFPRTGVLDSSRGILGLADSVERSFRLDSRYFPAQALVRSARTSSDYMSRSQSAAIAKEPLGSDIYYIQQ